MKAGDILICSKVKKNGPEMSSHHIDFTVGNKYPVAVSLNFFVYVLNNQAVSVRFHHTEIKKYFMSLEEWRDNQINKLL